MKDKVWRFKGEYNTDDGSLLTALARIRGIDMADTSFFIPDSLSLHDAFLLPDMDKAVERILLAKTRGERVCVYGDYDADGVSATYILCEALRALGIECDHYIPARADEGYGMNAEAVGRISARGSKLIVTVDTGITAFEEIRLAKTLGIDVVVTDHHECAAGIPEACAVVNPKRDDCDYPFKELAGVAVAFKLICALTGDMEDALTRFSPFVAIGTVADVMPLIGENRVLVALGIKAMQSSTHVGLGELLEQTGCAGKPLSAATLGFILAPHINAAGRMGSADIALDLFMADSQSEANLLCAKLRALNVARQGIEGEILEDCTSQLSAQGFLPAREGIMVLWGEEWRAGVIGIVASKLVERYCCPVVLAAVDENGIARGSGRGVEGFNLYECVRSASPLLSRFGGHDMAAGFTMDKSNLPEFKRILSAYAQAYMPETGFAKTVDIVCDVPAECLNVGAVKKLRVFEPFGTGNEQPLFSLSGVLIQDLRQVGTRHTRLLVQTGEARFSAIYFGISPPELPFEAGDYADIAFEPAIDRYSGTEAVQLIVRDMRFCERDRQTFDEQMQHFRRITAQEAVLGFSLNRQICAELWQLLSARKRDNRVTFDVRSLKDRSGGRIDIAKLLAAAEVFGQLGLLTYALDGFTMEAKFSAGGSKVVLSDSPLFLSLNSGNDEEEKLC